MSAEYSLQTLARSVRTGAFDPFQPVKNRSPYARTLPFSEDRGVLPAGAIVAGCVFHPLGNPAFPPRTPAAVIGDAFLKRRTQEQRRTRSHSQRAVTAVDLVIFQHDITLRQSYLS